MNITALNFWGFVLCLRNTAPMPETASTRKSMHAHLLSRSPRLGRVWSFLIIIIGAPTACASSPTPEINVVNLWGDSQTIPGSGYSDKLAAKLPENSVNMEGIGGQSTEMVAARMGALPVRVTQPVAISTDGACSTIPSKVLNIDLLRTLGAVISIRVSVDGKTPATLTYRPAQSPDLASYRLCYDAPHERAVSILPGTTLVVESGFQPGTNANDAPELRTLVSGTVVIRSGRNDLNGPSDLVAPLHALDAMVQKAKANGARVFVVGQMLGYYDLPLTMGGQRKAADTSRHLFDMQEQWNTALASRYGFAFIDVQKWHLDHGGGKKITLSSASQTHTYQVLTADAQSPKLRDGVHENEEGLDETAALIVATIAPH